jgi:imidazolonepropionase-like amidohydrolase
MHTNALLIGTLVLGASAPASATPNDGDALAIRAEQLHVGDGTVIENGIVVFEGGKITEVGKGAPVPKGVVLIEHAGHLSAGLIALREHAGAGGESRDTTRAVMDEADLAFAYRPDHSEVQALLAEGITTFVLAPRPGSLVGGLCVVAKTGKEVISRRAYLSICTGRNGLTSNRFPTSLQGSQAELERRFSWPQGVFALAVKGELPVMLDAGSTRTEIQHAIAFARRHGLKGILVGSTRLGEMAAKIRAAGLGVAISNFTPSTGRRVVEGALALSEMQVPFGFALGSPDNHPANLRLTAAACIRAGLKPGEALSALTSTAAQLAGVADKVGSVQKGLAADLVLWSGEPTDPGSQVMAVYVDGEEVFRAEDDENGDDQ